MEEDGEEVAAEVAEVSMHLCKQRPSSGRYNKLCAPPSDSERKLLCILMGPGQVDKAGQDRPGQDRPGQDKELQFPMRDETKHK